MILLLANEQKKSRQQKLELNKYEVLSLESIINLIKKKWLTRVQVVSDYFCQPHCEFSDIFIRVYLSVFSPSVDVDTQGRAQVTVVHWSPPARDVCSCSAPISSNPISFVFRKKTTWLLLQPNNSWIATNPDHNHWSFCSPNQEGENLRAQLECIVS